jgi:hypothetical protein
MARRLRGAKEPPRTGFTGRGGQPAFHSGDRMNPLCLPLARLRHAERGQYALNRGLDTAFDRS